MDCVDRTWSTDSAPKVDEFKIKGAATRALTTSDGAPDACTICLQPIAERAVAGPCNHLTFDFICLASWLQDHDTCPLCKATVVIVQYDWRSPTDYKTYHVHQARDERNAHSSTRRTEPLADAQDAYRETTLLTAADPSLQFRRRIYRNQLYALHVGSNTRSKFADFSPEAFAHSAELQSRARTFLRRELLLFTFLDRDPEMRVSGRQYLVEYIVAVLKIHHPKAADGQAEELLVQPLGRAIANQLLHELSSWLRSSCMRLEEWDAIVQYRSSGDDENAKHANDA